MILIWANRVDEKFDRGDGLFLTVDATLVSLELSESSLGLSALSGR